MAMKERATCFKLHAGQKYPEVLSCKFPTLPMQSQAAKSRTKQDANRVRRGNRRIAIVAVTPVRMLDVIGPAEVFSDANRLHGGRPFYEIEIISACDDRTVTSHIGVPFIADCTFG